MGAENIFNIPHLILTQPKEIQDIATPVVNDNSYYAYPENILEPMLEEENEAIRKVSLDKIRAVRAKGSVNFSIKIAR